MTEAVEQILDVGEPFNPNLGQDGGTTAKMADEAMLLLPAAAVDEQQVVKSILPFLPMIF